MKKDKAVDILTQDKYTADFCSFGGIVSSIKLRFFNDKITFLNEELQ